MKNNCVRFVAGLRRFKFQVSGFKMLAFTMAVLAAAQSARAAWWETGFDRWYYKDDWKAEFLSGGRTYGTTVTIPGEFVSAWVEVWAQEYTLRVNGEVVGQDRDAGTIEAYDLTEVLHIARNEIEITGGPEVIVDGGVVLRNGEVVPIRTDASWGRKGVRAGRERRSGPRGYMGNSHQALMLEYTPEQRAKAAVSRLHALVGRLRDRDQYRFWRVCDPAEVLDFGSVAYEIWADVLNDSAEATTVARLAEAAIARGEWDAVDRILNAPPRPVAPHLLDTASDLEAAISLRAARNAYRALKIQIDLLGRAGMIVEPSWPTRLQEIEAELRRAAAAKTPERVVAYLSAQIDENLSALRSEIEARLGVRLDPLNLSTQNRLGWAISNEPLDNDPRSWEFSFAPPAAEVLDLAGLWKFHLDPRDEGTTLGYSRGDFDDAAWPRIIAPHKWGWERLGYDQDNPDFHGKNNKPYNGHAWYRKAVFLPAAWKGRDLEIDLGVRGSNNRDWLFVNGQAVGNAEEREKGSSSGRFVIGADGVRTGSTNTLSLRVYNPENCGGLLGPRLWLYPAGQRPETLRTVCQAGIVQAVSYGKEARQAAYCGALSPAVLVAQTDNQFRLWGWEAKGYPAPACLAYRSGKQEEVLWLRSGLSIPGDELGQSWLLLAPHPAQLGATSCPLSLLVVLQRKPKQVRWEQDAFGGSALVVDFQSSAGIVGLVRPLKPGAAIDVGPDGNLRLHPFAGSVCNRWATLIRAYPVAYAEVYSEDEEKASVHIGYEHFETDDDWQTERVRHAPAPMLLTYARENDWPGIGLDVAARVTAGAAFTADPTASYCGAYMARVGDSALVYTYGRREPPILWKGVGTLGEIRNMTDRDFERLRQWGANCCRPQIAFDRNWFVKGFFETDKGDGRSGLEGRLLWDESAVQWLDGIVNLHQRHDVTCILNWFWNADYPLREIQGAPPNSARYWKHKPAARQLIIDFWAKVADHYAGLPANAIAYDFLNEPATLTSPEYNAFIKDATAAIRAHDKTHTIFVESANGWAQPEDFDHLQATGDPKTVYEFHFYGPHTFDSYSRDLWFPRYDHRAETFQSWEALEERLLAPVRFSVRNGGVPLCHGEFGITFLGPGEAPRQWLEALLTLHDKYRTGWIWWNWDGGSIHRTGLVSGERVNPLVATLSRFMRKDFPEVRW